MKYCESPMAVMHLQESGAVSARLVSIWHTTERSFSISLNVAVCHSL